MDNIQGSRQVVDIRTREMWLSDEIRIEKGPTSSRVKKNMQKCGNVPVSVKMKKLHESRGAN